LAARLIMKKLRALFKGYLKRKELLQYLTPRSKLAYKYIQGTGLEIGALHSPLDVPNQAVVKYVDVVPKNKSVEKFPELNPDEIVNVDYVTDGFSLEGVEKGWFDFLIANHVLEHSPNPIKVLENWLSVLKVGGILYFALPEIDHYFDKGRKLTTLEHLLKDYEFYNRLGDRPIGDHNLDHYKEWVAISNYNITKIKYSNGEHETLVNNLNNEQAEIHFHTFNYDSIINLLNYLESNLLENIEILEITQPKKGEIISICRKK